MSLLNIANTLILVSSVIWFIHLIPQIIKTVKTKDVNGLSILFYIMSIIAYLMFIFGISIKQDWVVVFSQIPAYLCNVVMLALIMKYKNAQYEEKVITSNVPTPEEVEAMEEPKMLMLLYRLGYKILKEK